MAEEFWMRLVSWCRSRAAAHLVMACGRTLFHGCRGTNFCDRQRTDLEFHKLVQDTGNSLASAGAGPRKKVYHMYGQRLEIRQQALVVNEREIKHATSVAHMPKHMRSVSTINVPKTPSTKDDVVPADDTERLFVFADPSAPSMTATLISSLGFDCYDAVMERCFLKGQGRATVDAGIVAQSAATGQHILDVNQRMKFVTLQNFIGR